MRTGRGASAIVLIVLLLVAGTAAATAAADVDEWIPLKFNTTLVEGKSYLFTFSLHDAADIGTGTVVWEEAKVYKVPRGKVVSHNLGSVVPFASGYGGGPPVDFSQQLWAQAQTGSFVVRVKLTPLPFAIRSELAGGVARGIPSSSLGSGAVTSNAIAAGAVTSGKISAGSVATPQLGNAAVTQAKLGGGAVGSDQIATDAVTSAKIAADAVTGSKVGLNALSLLYLRIDPERFEVSASNGGSNTIHVIPQYFCFLSEFSATEGSSSFSDCVLNFGSDWSLQATAAIDAQVSCAAICFAK